MPGHRSPDGTVMVHGGQPTHREDDSKIGKVQKRRIFAGDIFYGIFQ